MRSVFLIAVIGLFFAGVASAQFRVGVTGGEKGSIPVAVLELYAEQSGSSQHARDLTKIMRQNLSKSGAFEVVEPTAYPQQAADFLENPDWRGWRESPAQALVVGSVSVNESDIEVKYFLLRKEGYCYIPHGFEY